jgi:hypothetical protein
MDPPFRLVETAYATYLVIPSRQTEVAASSALEVHAMAAAVVDVEVKAAASVAAVDQGPLHRAVLRRPQAATAPRRHRTPPDLSPAVHPHSINQ